MLLLNCVVGEAVKPKISCEKNRGMGSVLTEYVTETFRAFPKNPLISLQLSSPSHLTLLRWPYLVFYSMVSADSCYVAEKRNFIFHYVCNKRVVLSSYCLYGCLKIKNKIKGLLCIYKWQNSNIRKLLKVPVSKSLLMLNVPLLYA